MARKPRSRKQSTQRNGPPVADLERIAALIGQKLYDAARNDLLRLRSAFPNNADIENLLGVAYYHQGRLQEAAAAYANAVRAAPSHPLLSFNKGRLELELGALEKAANSFKRALKLKPDFAEARALLGDVHARRGQITRAEESYRAALELQTRLPSALMGLGLLNLRRGDAQAAEALFRTLLETLPEDAPARAAALANLGLALDRCGRKPEAIDALFEAVDRAPDEARFRGALARSLRHVKDAPEGDRAYRVLSSLAAAPGVNPRTIGSAVQACLRRRHGLGGLLERIARDPAAAASVSAEDRAQLDALYADPLFLAFIAGAPVADAAFEILLTQKRAALLRASADGASIPLDLAAALAGQCWANEYVFFVSTEETDTLKALRARLSETPLSAFAPDDWARLALFCAYAPMSDSPVGETPPERAPDLIQSIFRQQVQGPLRERALADEIPSFGDAEDAVSAAVEKQYAENPYPRWSRCDLAAPAPLAETIRAELPHLDPTETPQIDAPRILIAGCGTGLQTMKVVCSYRGASVLAVDLSRPSLAYGMRKLEEYGVRTVEHKQANILDLGALDERFDLIESYGVIHHMEDPAAALGVLAGLLKPGGLLYLGLYSELGRQSVVEARRVIAERGYADTPAGIRQARRDIICERDERLTPLLSPASDFWTLSDTRDLIFHVQEHRFRLPQIGAMLTERGLEFLGLATPSAADRLAFEQEHGAAAVRDIEAWDAFERAHPDAFGDTYKIWARRTP